MIDWFLKLVALVFFFGGCSKPEVQFHRVECQRIEKDGQLEAIAFSSLIDLRGLNDRQLVFHVGLFDNNRQPIKSRDGRFQNTSGNVAVGKTLMGWSAPLPPRNISVVIPANQLEVQQSLPPVWAEFGVYYPDQTCLAREFAQLPLKADDAVLALNSWRRNIETPPSERRGDVEQPPEKAEPNEPVAPPQREQVAEKEREPVDQVAKSGTREKQNEDRSRRPSAKRAGTSTTASSSYTVKQGDTLRSIALESYGDARMWRLIHEANPGMPVWLRPGDVINIPGRRAPGNTQKTVVKKTPLQRDIDDKVGGREKPLPRASRPDDRTETLASRTKRRETRRDTDRTSKRRPTFSAGDKSQAKPSGELEGKANNSAGKRQEPEVSTNKQTPSRSKEALSKSFESLITNQERRVAENSHDLEQLFRLRMMYAIAGKDDKALAPIPMADDNVERAMLARLRTLVASRSGHRGRAPTEVYNEQLKSIEDLRQLLQPQAKLVVRRVVFCSRIDGFGQYDPIEPARFPAGKKTLALIYLEVENFVCKKSANGLHQTLLSVNTKVKNSKGDVIHRANFDKIEDLARRKRHDFFLTIRAFEIPKELTEGEYSVEVEVKDLLGGSAGLNAARFKISS